MRIFKPLTLFKVQYNYSSEVKIKVYVWAVV